MQDIIKKAREEVKQEQYRALVEAEKIKLRSKRSLWDKLFPFVIKIERKK